MQKGEGWEWSRAGQQPLRAQYHSRRASLEEKDKGEGKEMERGETKVVMAYRSENCHLHWLQC